MAHDVQSVKLGILNCTNGVLYFWSFIEVMSVVAGYVVDSEVAEMSLRSSRSESWIWFGGLVSSSKSEHGEWWSAGNWWKRYCARTGMGAWFSGSREFDLEVAEMSPRPSRIGIWIQFRMDWSVCRASCGKRGGDYTRTTQLTEDGLSERLFGVGGGIGDSERVAWAGHCKDENA